MERNRILIADDFRGIPELYERLLKSELSTETLIEIFRDGTSLVNRLDQDVSDVVLVLTDNEMPGVCGSEVIRRYAPNSEFPFVLVYGGDEEIGKEVVDNGAYGFLRKPFEYDSLIQIVKEALNSSRD